MTVRHGPPIRILTSPPSQSVKAGQQASFTVSVVRDDNSFIAPVLLSCPGGLPAGASCSFSPPTVTPGPNAVVATLTVQTGGSSVAAGGNLEAQHVNAALAIWLPFPLIGLAGAGLVRRKGTRLKSAMALLCIVCSFATFLGGCAALTQHSVTPQGTYIIVIAGSTSEGAQQTTAMLTIQ